MDEERGLPIVRRKAVPVSESNRILPLENERSYLASENDASPGDESRLTVRRKPVPNKSDSAALAHLHERDRRPSKPDFNVRDNALDSQGNSEPSESKALEPSLKTTNDDLGKVPGSLRFHHRWHVSWTSRSAFIAFVVLLFATIIGLILLRQLSHSQGGFALSLSTNPYTWKYGPTAVLTLAVALWRQVDRSVRLEAPWVELSKGYTLGRRGILLDYISPILPSALWTAMRNRHWRVLTTISIFGLLKLAILFSTGLLVTKTVSATKADSSITLKLLGGAKGDPNDDGTPSSYYTDRLYDDVVYNLTFPPGVTLEAAFQEMSDITEFPPESLVTAQVLAFFPDLACTETTINVGYGASYAVDGSGMHNAPLELSFQSPECSGSLIDSQPTCSFASWTDCDFSSTYLASTSSAYCEAFDGDTNHPDQANAIVFAIVKMAKDPGSLATGESKAVWTSGILCRTSYAIETADLTVDTQYPFYPGGKTLSPALSHTERQIPGYAPSNLTSDFASQIYHFDQRGAFLRLAATHSDIDYSNLDFTFQLMLTVTSDFDMEKLRDTSALTKSATKVFRALCAQFVGSWLSFPQHLMTNGSYSSPSQRLFIQSSATWEMCVALGVATLGVLMLIFLARPRTEHPSSFSELTASANKDPALIELLSTAGHKTEKQMSSLSSLRFTFSHDSHGQPQLLAESDQHPVDDARETSSYSNRYNIDWWIPLTGRRWFTALCVLIPSAEIAILEVLQRKSDAHNGICDTEKSFETVHDLVSLIPAGLMLLTATLYSSVEFNVGIFAPYHMMKKKFPRFKQMNQNPAGDLPILALFRCLARGYYVVVVMIAATTIGSLLTVIVSGLYAVNEVSRAQETTIITTDQFNPSWNQTSDELTEIFFPAIQQYDMSFPPGTFETFAYPSFSLDHSDPNIARILRSDNTTTLDITMPVTRASLDCTLVPRNEIYYGPATVKSLFADGTTTTQPGVGLQATHPLPKECQQSTGTWKDSTNLRVSVNFTDDINEIWALPAWVETVPGKSYSNNYPPNCPSIAYTIGNYQNNTDNSGKTVFVCTQIQEEIPALLRFNIPSLSLDTTFSPQLDEQKARKVSAYQYYQSGSALLTTSSFYTDWVKQITGLSLADMQGPSNADRFLNATQHVYRMIMALTIGDGMRVASSELNSTNTVPTVTQAGSRFTGVIQNRNVLRISQNKTSKLILQAFLGAMLACFLVVYPLVDTRSTLPHSPCSVAGTLSLLFGSNFSRMIRQACDEGDDYSTIDRRLADKKMRLGWWENSEGGTPRFGVDIFDEAREI